MKRYFQWPLDGIIYARNRFAQGDSSTDKLCLNHGAENDKVLFSLLFTLHGVM